MPETLERPSGLRITIPDTHTLVTAEPAPAPQRRTGGRLPRGPVPLPGSGAETSPTTAALLAALESQEMAVVDRVSLQPSTAPAQRARRAGEATGPQSVEMTLDVAPEEDAALLLVQGGMYSWSFPTEVETEPAAPSIRRRGRAEAGRRRVTFRVALARESTETAAVRRGVGLDVLWGAVEAIVVRFVARLVVGQTMKYLERNVRRGFTFLEAHDPTRWRHAADLSSLRLPENRAPRLLLLLHGTFSSTVGSFGALGATPWGRAFLHAASANYDAVIGFDHPTLSEDPLENATELLRLLKQRFTGPVPHFDVIAFSRGGLVFRSLVEHLLPVDSWRAEFGRAIFVAATNGGTGLAEPKNWHRLLDLYTNLAAAAGSLVSAFAPTTAAGALVLKEAVQGLGALVKRMATEVLAEGRVPGLAAMDPRGPFIRTINETQPGQPDFARSYYCAVTAVFAPRLEGDHEPRELSRRLLLWVTGRWLAQLMGASHDLVVNTESMMAIDPGVGVFVKDRLEFGETPHVYHTIYFTRPEVTDALARWLQLADPGDVVGAGARRTRRPRPSLPLPPLAAPGEMVSPEPSVGEVWSGVARWSSLELVDLARGFPPPQHGPAEPDDRYGRLMPTLRRPPERELVAANGHPPSERPVDGGSGCPGAARPPPLRRDDG
jgi:hypothetical protein